MTRDLKLGRFSNDFERVPTDIIVAAKDNLVNHGRKTVAGKDNNLFTGRSSLPGVVNYGHSMIEVIQKAIVDGRLDIGAITPGAADGVLTGGSFNAGTGAIDYTAAAPATGFSVTLPTIPTDLSQLGDTTDLLKSYTLQPDGTTGVKLVDENGLTVNTVPFPSGSGADTFMSFVEGTTSTTFTSADGNTTVTIPTIDSFQGFSVSSDLDVSIPIATQKRVRFLGDTYTDTSQTTGTGIDSALITFSLDMTALNEDISPKAINVRVEDVANNFPTDNLEAILTFLDAKDTAAVIINDTNTIDWTAGGLDNQTFTGHIQGSQSASNGQILSSNGDGTISWINPAAGTTVSTSIIDGDTNPVDGNAIFDALTLKANIADLHEPMTAVDSNSVDFTVSGTDNQTVTAIVAGADTAIINQVATSDGAGGITWSVPTAAATVDTTIVDGGTNAVTGNAIFDALALKADVTDLHVPATINSANSSVVIVPSGTDNQTFDLSVLASNVPITDVAGNITATTVEGALAELAAIAHVAMTTTDTDTVDFTVSGTDNQAIVADVKLAPAQSGIANAITVVAGQGLYVPPVPTALQWYTGGDSMRVWATYDPFAAGYTKNAAGNYSFVVPAGEQLDRLEYQVLPSGANQNIATDGSTIFSITTPNGNTSILDASTPNVIFNSGGTGGNIANSNTPAAGGTTWSTAFNAGTLTLTGSSLNPHAGGVVSITNLIQNA